MLSALWVAPGGGRSAGVMLYFLSEEGADFDTPCEESFSPGAAHASNTRMIIEAARESDLPLLMVMELMKHIRAPGASVRVLARSEQVAT
jgi:hypothetical protein